MLFLHIVRYLCSPKWNYVSIYLQELCLTLATTPPSPLFIFLAHTTQSDAFFVISIQDAAEFAQIFQVGKPKRMLEILCIPMSQIAYACCWTFLFNENAWQLHTGQVCVIRQSLLYTGFVLVQLWFCKDNPMKIIFIAIIFFLNNGNNCCFNMVKCFSWNLRLIFFTHPDLIYCFCILVSLKAGLCNKLMQTLFFLRAFDCI